MSTKDKALSKLHRYLRTRRRAVLADALAVLASLGVPADILEFLSPEYDTAVNVKRATLLVPYVARNY